MNTPAAPAESSTATAPLWLVVAASLWLLGFAFCFYQFDLPNSGPPRVNRTEVWKQLPSLLVNTVDPPEPSAVDLETRRLWKNAGWRYLPQRFGFYAVTLAILGGAWAWGNLLLRVLGVPLSCWSAERTFFALVCGLSVVSLLTLGCGLAGVLTRLVLGGLLAAGLIGELVARVLTFSSIDLGEIGRCWSCLDLRRSWPLLVMLPFLMCYVGGGFLPEVDFDVKEYHFGGPKEWYQAGQISFLPHNVYTSFPFLAEMLTLLGMVLYGDWFWGALAGKGVLMTFGPLTALGIYVAGRRWFSPQAGIWAALIHLSTPWIYRISTIAGVEGALACYLFASLLAVLFYVERVQNSDLKGDPDGEPDRSGTWAVLTGFLSGSAMACKYPGVVSVVIPCGLALVVMAGRSSQGGTVQKSAVSRAFWCGVIFTCGVLLAVGPWLLKNLLETGNPVYPLLYNVFGGVDWNAELNAKWKHGHSPDHHQLLDLAIKLMDVTLKSDWLSPLLFGLAPLAWLIPQRRLVRGLWIYVAFLFGTWWLLTHRIDRFWVPLIPVVSLLAGVGATWTRQRAWRIFVTCFAICAATFNFVFMTTSLCGYNAYLLDLNLAAEQTARITAPEVVMLNSALPPESKVLCVGEAELFDARFPYVYNTVFDTSIFEDWLGVGSSTEGSANRPLKPTAEIRQILKDHGITHVFVNWQEILRYRQTYGYTDFVTPRRFQQLQADGILGAEWQVPGGQLFDKMDAKSQQEVRRWGPELIREDSGQAVFKTYDVFPVVP